MSDSYVECLIEGKKSVMLKFAKVILIILTVITGLVGFTIQPLFVFAAFACGIGAYFAGLYSNVEYEYLYLDKEITVSKIFSQSKRKKAGVYELEKIEIMAPIKSYRLDYYKNRTFKIVDISRGFEDKPDRRYTFYYNGREQIIFEPNEAMIKMLKSDAPRKVYTD